MKRTICLLVSLFLLIGTLPAAAEVASGEIDETFETVGLGALPEGWTITVNGVGASVGVVQESSENKAVKLVSPANTNVSLESPVIPFDLYTISWRVKLDAALTTGTRLMALGEPINNGTDNKGFRFGFVNNSLFLRDVAGSTKVDGMTADRWYTVKVVVVLSRVNEIFFENFFDYEYMMSR